MKLMEYCDSYIPLFLPNSMNVSGRQGYEKDMRLSIGSLSRASLAALSPASFPIIPTCPGTHMKTISFWSTSFYSTYCRFVPA